MDLGQKRPDPPTAAAQSAPDMPDKTYPSFTLNDEVAKKFMKHYGLELNDECEVHAKIRLTGLRDDQYGTGVTLDVLSMDHDDGEESGEEYEKKPAKKERYKNPGVEQLDMD